MEEAKDKLETYVNEIKEEIIIEFHNLINEALKLEADLESPVDISLFTYKDMEDFKYNDSLPQPTSYINDQENYGKWRYGLSTIKDAGCGVIAGYNLSLAIGKRERLAETTIVFDLLGIRNVGFGYFGSNPYECNRYLDYKDISYCKASSYSEFKSLLKAFEGRSYHMILSAWNEVKLTAGGHLYYVDKDLNRDKQFKTYNFWDVTDRNGTNDVEKLFYDEDHISDNFMCAYFVLK